LPLPDVDEGEAVVERLVWDWMFHGCAVSGALD
jgi:hypothetical protein